MLHYLQQWHVNPNGLTHHDNIQKCGIFTFSEKSPQKPEQSW